MIKDVEKIYHQGKGSLSVKVVTRLIGHLESMAIDELKN